METRVYPNLNSCVNGCTSIYKAKFMLLLLIFISTTNIYSQCSNPIQNFPISEDFENGTTSIDWIQDTTDDFDWTIDSGGTPSATTGPSSGNDGSTWYMYTEASGVNRNGKIANLISPCLKIGANASLDFAYHMYGTLNVGSFSVDVRTIGSSNWVSVWSRSGNQGDQWNSETIDFSSYAGNDVEFRFSVTTLSFRTDIAIDDIVFNSDEYNGCPNNDVSFDFCNTGIQSGDVSIGNPSQGDLFSITYALETQPSEGTVIMQDDGSFFYTPNGSGANSDQFSFTRCYDYLDQQSDSVMVFNPCGSGKVIETYIEGIEGENNPSIDIGSTDGIDRVFVEVWTENTCSSVIIEGQVATVHNTYRTDGSLEPEKLYRVELTSVSPDGLIDIDYTGNNCRRSSASAYVERTTADNLGSSFLITSDIDLNTSYVGGAADCRTFHMPLGTSDGPRDIEFTIPLHEKDNVRIVTATVTAGAQTQTASTSSYSDIGEGAGLIVVNMTDIPADVTSATIEVCSPAGNGDSFGIGILSANNITCGEPMSTMCCSEATATVNFSGLSLELDYNGSLCLTDNSALSAIVTGGSPNYTYQWTGPNNFSGNSQTVAINQNGNYAVTVTDGDGCSASTTGFVFNEFEPFIFTLNTEVCEGASVDLSVNSNSSFTYQWGANADNSSSNSVTVVPSYPSTDYVVTVTNSEGCQSTATATIDVIQKDNVQVTGDNILCQQETTTLSPSSGGQWQSTNNSVATVSPSGIVTAQGEGTATFVFTNSSTGCESDPTLPITVYDKPDVSITGASVLCVDETTTLSPTSGGTWFSSNNNVATVSPGGIVTPVGTGTVSFTFRNNVTDCLSDPTSDITIHPVPVVSIDGSNNLCVGATVALNSNVNGTWTSSNNAVATVSSAGIITGVSAGTASFSFLSINGCSPSGMINVTVDGQVVTSITGNNMLCEDESITLSASHSGGVWSSSNESVATINNSGVVTGLTQGTISITYSFPSASCNSDAIFALEIKGKPVANLAGMAEICVGESTQLTVNQTGGFWSSNNESIATVSNTGTVIGLSGGNTNFYYTSSNGCVSENTALVTVNPPLDLTIDFNGSICLTENSVISANASGGTGTYTYTWTGPGGFLGNTQSIDIVLDGNYFVTVEDEKGCSVSQSAFIYEEYEPFITSLNTTVCEDEQVTLSVNGQNVSSYQWGASAGNATSQTVTVTPSVPSTVYTVTVTNTLGCSVEAVSELFVESKPTVNIVGQEDICVGETTQLSPSSGGIWTSSNSTVATVSNSGLVSGNSNGTAVFTFRDNTTGCFSDATGPITVSNNAPVTLSGNNILCLSDVSLISATIPGGQWVSNNTNVATVNSSGLVTPISQGSTSITYSVTGGECFENGTIDITVNNDPILTLNGPSTICEGDFTFVNASTSGSWISSDPNIATVTNTGIVTGISGGNVTLSFVSNIGCNSILSSTITVVDGVSLSLTGPGEICEDETTTLSPTSGGFWLSSNNSVASVNTSGVVTGKSAGTVSFSFIESTNGCQSDDNIVVIVHGPPSINGLADTEICIGGTTNITPSSGGTWSSTNESVATITDFGVITGMGQGTARFIFTNDATGCSSNVSSSLQVNGKPTISFNGETIVCKGETSSILPSSGGQWSSSNVNVATITPDGIITAVNPGTVSFTFLSNVTGCTSDNSEPFVVEEPTSIALTGPGEICIGETTNLIPNSGGTWISNNPDVATITNNGEITGQNSGLASFTFFSDTDCASDPSLNIEVLESPSVVFTGPSGICIGSTTTLSPTTGGQWSSSDSDVAVVDNNGLVTSVGVGTVEFTFTENLSGCISTLETLLTVYDQPIIGIQGDDEVCIGFNTFLTPNSGGVWTSSNNAIAIVTSTGQVTGVSPGTATFTFTETGSNCVAQSTNPITVLNSPQAIIVGPNMICEGGMTELSPSTGGVWVSDNENVAVVSDNGVVTGINQGIARFTFISNAGCSSNQSSPVIVFGPPQVFIGGQDEMCIGDEIQIQPSNGGVWSSTNPDVASIDNNGLVLAISPGTVRFIFEDTNTGCVSSPSEEVTVNNAPITGVNGPSEICEGGETYLTPSTGGVWTALDPTIATIQNNGLVTGVSSGSPRFRFTQLSSGCESDINIDISVVSGPPIGFDGASEVCIGESTSISSFGVLGTWVSTNDNVATISDQGDIVGVSAGIVQFRFTDLNTGCTSELSEPFTVNGMPQVTVGGAAIICIDGTSFLSPATGGSWESLNSDVATVTEEGIVTAVAEGIAYFRFTDHATGCKSDGQLNIEVSPVINTQIVGESEICAGYTTILSPSTGGLWTSNNPDIATVSNSGVVTGVAPGIATFTFVDSNTGCNAGGTTGPVTVSKCLNHDFNVSLVNQMINGNLNTNDIIGSDATYSNIKVTIERPIASNPVLNINPDGTYDFTTNIAGKYLYKVSVCLPPSISGCPSNYLEINVLDNVYGQSNPISNLEFATTYSNVDNTLPGGTITIDALSNDDCVFTSGCSLDINSLSIINSPINGNASVGSDGSIEYTPNPGFVGYDTLDYEICVLSENVCSRSMQVITVNAVTAGNSIVLADDFGYTLKGVTLSGDLSNNDMDPEDDSFTIVSQGSSVNPIIIPEGEYFVNADGSYSFTPNSDFSGALEIIYEACDDNTEPACANATLHIQVFDDLAVFTRVYIEGSLIQNNDEISSNGRPLMRDNLRNSPFDGENHIPVTDPYSFVNEMFDDTPDKFVKVGPGLLAENLEIMDSLAVFSVTGENAIVDWIFVEIRDGNDDTDVIATRSGLLQRDGDIVDLDGVSPLRFQGVNVDSFYIVVKHRTHLGVMSEKVANGTMVDFTSPTTKTYNFGTSLNNNRDYTGLSQKANVKSGYLALWAGDFNSDGLIKFTEPASDINILFGNVLLNSPEFLINYDFAYGYYRGDFDMDGKAKFANPNDDRNYLLAQIIFHPLNTNFISNLDGVIEQVPASRK